MIVTSSPLLINALEQTSLQIHVAALDTERLQREDIERLYGKFSAKEQA